jgi:hypothetical protein
LQNSVGIDKILTLTKCDVVWLGGEAWLVNRIVQVVVLLGSLGAHELHSKFQIRINIYSKTSILLY